MTALGSLLTEVGPGFACGKEDADGIFQFRMHNISKSSELVLDKRRRVPRDAHKQLARFHVRPGDILFNATNSPDGVGKSILVPNLDEPAVFSNHFLRLRVHENLLNPAYLWRWLQYQYRHGVFLGLTRRWVNQATVSRDDLLALDIPELPLDEQRRIAAILDHADTLRTKRRQALAHLDTLPQAIFHKMFGAGGFPSVRAGELMPAMRNGLSPSTGGQHHATVLTLSAITQGSFDPSANKPGAFAIGPPADKRVAATDFLMCRGNGNQALVGVGTYSRVDRADLVFPDTVIAGRVNTALVQMEYLSVAWAQRDVRKQIEALARTTNGTFKVNQQSLASIELPLPPLGLQREFAHAVAKLDRRKAGQHTAATAKDELFTSLQSRAFKGEL